MSAISYKEFRLSNDILINKEKYYAVSSKDIRGITIGGISDSLRFMSYPISDGEEEVMVLEVKFDGERYYFKPIFSDDYILIISEDYFYGESDSLNMGEIKTCNNRLSAFRNFRFRDFGGPDLSLESNRDLITNNPLGVYLDSLEPLSSINNNGESMVNYNIKFSHDLNHKLSRMKMKAQDEAIRSYEKIYKSKKYSKN